jgi:hypothetical protein
MNALCRIEREPVTRQVQARPRPDDFEVIFVEQGRLECETWYRCRRTTVDRWLEEAGKERLIAERAAFVKLQREQRRVANSPRKTVAQTLRDKRRVSPALARKAAHFLRCVRNGGWVCTPAPDNTWLVGTRRRTPGELVDMACQRGFDRRAANLQIAAEEREN